QRAAVAGHSRRARRRRRAVVDWRAAADPEAQSPADAGGDRHARRLRELAAGAHAQLSRTHVDSSGAVRRRDDCDGRREAVRAMTTGRRRALFAVAAVMIAGVFTFGALLAVDVYLHGRYQRSAGFNVWGYRGRPAGSKKAGEYRVVMLG